MSNQVVRRSGGQAVSLVIAAALLAPAILSAQVGHDPDRSPFHDITTTQGISFLFGRFAGARAAAPVGARPGAFAAVRLETRLGGPLDLYITAGQAYSNRFQVVPSDTIDRVRGPINQTLLAVDAALILNVTGAKRWHALAPYFGVGFGLLTAQPGKTDPGGFRVGSNFIMAPTIGTNIHISRSLVCRLEMRDYWLRYEWPLAYYSPVDTAGNDLPEVLPSSQSTRQITHNLVLTAGLSYRFTF